MRVSSEYPRDNGRTNRRGEIGATGAITGPCCPLAQHVPNLRELRVARGSPLRIVNRAFGTADPRDPRRRFSRNSSFLGGSAC